MSDIVSYTGKTVVVTGGATGVGAALVDLLAGAGASRVFVLDIKAAPGPAETLRVDLADPAAIDNALARLPERVDVLFNNAGVAATSAPEVVIAVNVLAGRRIATGLRDRMPRGSAVVNTGSTAGGGYPAHLDVIREFLAVEGWDDALAWAAGRPDLMSDCYAFSKECVHVGTMQLAASLRGQGIRVNGVSPGVIETPLLTDFNATMGAARLDWMVTQSGGRRASAREVAAVLAFLGSDAASYISGTHVLVDNGFTAALTTQQLDLTTFPG